nr:hypothetical protein [Tanacetum cinerariifolium]
MSFDDLYNNFKIVEQEIKGTTSSSSSSQNMAFVSSPSSTNEVNTAYGVSTANTQVSPASTQVSPASTQVSTASTQVSTANLSDATVYAFLASQPNGLQKIVSRIAILGVIITQEDLNSKFLRSLPPEWNTHVVVWMNKADIETMSIDNLYNNFKIVEQDVKKSIGASTGAQNMAFMTAPSTSSTNDVNTSNPAYEASTVSPNVNTVSPQVSTANFSDNVMYAFMVENPNGSNLL